MAPMGRDDGETVNSSPAQFGHSADPEMSICGVRPNIIP
jgi:hypothetical protein